MAKVEMQSQCVWDVEFERFRIKPKQPYVHTPKKALPPAGYANKFGSPSKRRRQNTPQLVSREPELVTQLPGNGALQSATVALKGIRHGTPQQYGNAPFKVGDISTARLRSQLPTTRCKDDTSTGHFFMTVGTDAYHMATSDRYSSAILQYVSAHPDDGYADYIPITFRLGKSLLLRYPVFVY